MDYQLYNNDCIKQMQQLIQDDVKVDLILTDLPYGITSNEWDNIIPFQAMWEQIENIIHDRTPIVFSLE